MRRSKTHDEHTDGWAVHVDAVPCDGSGVDAPPGAMATESADATPVYPPDDVVVPDHGAWTRGHYPVKIREFKAHPLATNDVVFIGDSITEKGNNWAARFGSPRVKNRGIAGDMTQGVIVRLGEIYYYPPAAVFIMIVANALSGGMSQLFADIRTNWTPASIKKASGRNVEKICPRGIIDKRNSGAGALEYGIDLYKICGLPLSTPVQQFVAKYRANPKLQQKAIAAMTKATQYMAAALTYFPGDGLSSHYRTPGGLPMTAYRYNMVGDLFTCSVVEGETVELPDDVANLISKLTDATWPETYWTPFGMTSFEYMDKIGPNHDGNSLGLIGADLLTFNAMLRIPVDMHNVPADQVFRPTMWHRFGGDDFRVCEYLGPVYG